ncbi:MAG: hypothetical protein R6U43_07290 [Candidatus Krumholzibacteriales bacterium]
MFWGGCVGGSPGGGEVCAGGEEKEEELQEELITEIEIREKTEVEYASGEEIFFRRKPWYEKQRWNEILDERTRWVDLSKENQKKLIKLIGRR